MSNPWIPVRPGTKKKPRTKENIAMIIVSGRIHIAPGQREGFLASSREAVVAARRAPGCRDFVVGADPIDPDRVNVYEEWDSDRQLEAFRGAGPGPELTQVIERAEVCQHHVASAGAVQHVSVHIARPSGEVYDFASDPRNLSRWAAGLARSEVRPDGDDWIGNAPFGTVRLRFAPRNSFGVMDHDVTLESGVTIHNPMRVVPHGDGSEVVFTLIRRPEMSDAQLAEDTRTVENDLKTLRDLLERRSSA
jgi:quinol monooxygenase YgiN